MINKKFSKILVGSTALLAGLSVGTLVATAASAQGTASIEVPKADLTTENYDVGNLLQGKTAELPEHVRSSETGASITPETIRLVYSDFSGDIFTGLNDDGLLCLIVYLDETDWTVASVCGDPEHFNKTGMGLRTTGELGEREAYLIPDSLAQQNLSTMNGVSVQTDYINLIIVDPDINVAERQRLMEAYPETQIWVPSLEER